MKKIIIALLTVAMILSVATVFASAAEQTAEQISYVGGIHYGEAVIDGEKDMTYPQTPTIDSFVYSDAAYEEGKETSFNAYLLWDEYNFYGYVEVTDYTPVTYAAEDWKTDCIQLYFIFQNWDELIGADDNLAGDTNSLTAAMFRCINATSKESSYLTDATFGGKSLLWNLLNNKANCPLVTKKTDNGYVYEFKIVMPDMIAPDINRAGHAIGFGIQCNDDINDDHGRDYIVFSSNMNQKEHGKTGKFILLNANGQVPSVEQDYMGTTGADYVTSAPADDETKVTTEEVTNPPKAPTTTTKAPVTTNKPVDNTTKVPTTTEAPAESGCAGFAGVWVAFTAIVGAAAFVVVKKK